MLRHHREHSSKDVEPAFVVFKLPLAMMSLTAAFRVSDTRPCCSPCFLPIGSIRQNAAPRTTVIRFPAMRSSISIRVEMAQQDILPVATAKVARWRMPCLYSNNADLHLLRIGRILYMRRQRGRVTMTPSSVLLCT